MWWRPLLVDAWRSRHSSAEDLRVDARRWHLPAQESPRKVLKECRRAAQVEIGLPRNASSREYVQIQMSAGVEIPARSFGSGWLTVNDVFATASKLA